MEMPFKALVEKKIRCFRHCATCHMVRWWGIRLLPYCSLLSCVVSLMLHAFSFSLKEISGRRPSCEGRRQ